VRPSRRIIRRPPRAVGAAVRLRHEDRGAVGLLLDDAGLLRWFVWHYRLVRLMNRINHRLDVAAQRSAPVFDEETRQWRFPEEGDVPTGYWVAEGCSWFGPVGWASAALIAVVTWLRHRRRRDGRRAS
jgi:hypothetical protein